MVLKQFGMASVSIQAGVEGFLELEPNSNTRFLSGRTVKGGNLIFITGWREEIEVVATINQVYKCNYLALIDTCIPNLLAN